MVLIHTVSDLQIRLSKKKHDDLIGFVPTMGALHPGHLSLIEKAIADNHITVVSIFVNPTQFNDARDFQSYPKNFEKDLSIMKPLLRNDDLVFMPEDKEMYPEPDTREFYFGVLEQVMEGRHRPGHFNGVAQIVSKLFEMVGPDRAYFGQKDFQQLRIVQKLAEHMQAPIEIVPCPIIREPDGLAMSSRNVLLRPEVRKDTPKIFKSLERAKKLAFRRPVRDVKKITIEFIHQSPFLEVEYFEIVDGRDLSSVNNWNDASSIYGCIAVYAGGIRLIDNIHIR